MFQDSLYSQFIYKSRYARYLDKEKRREDWLETVQRYMDFIVAFLQENNNFSVPKDTIEELTQAILDHNVMPSMRGLMTAGPAAMKNQVAFYNCAFLPIDDFRSFDEEMAILMSGTGVGFSVEQEAIKNLPIIPEEFFPSNSTIVFEDSRIGWAKGYREFISILLTGQIPKYDISKLRPAGSRLKTMGGRSSGPLPLVEVLEFTINLFMRAKGRKLTSIEAHDLACKIADIVVVGGVRRSALISLSDLEDQRMREAKTGNWWQTHPYRRLANNSAIYNEKPDVGTFMKEWISLYNSKSGERGIFSRDAVANVIENANNFRLNLGLEDIRTREFQEDFGVNPCLHPDSIIETIHGRIKIKDISKPTMVYSMDKNGKLCLRSCSASWISKKNTNTIKITIASGKQLICTPDHKIFVEAKGWVKAENIKIGDRVIHLIRSRRGVAYSGVRLTSQDKSETTMEHRMIFEGYYGPIPEGFDVHHIDGDTYNNDIDNLECLSHSDHARITALEQPNNHMIVGFNEKLGRLGFISPENSRHGQKIIIPIPEELKSNLHQYASVIRIEEGPITDVYDLSVEDTHNFISNFIVVHNCSEIILRPYEFCNLTSVQIYEDDNYVDLVEKIRIATILGTFQSCLTNFRYLNKKWKRNCEEERLLGVSLNGIFDNDFTNGKKEGLEYYLKGFKQIAIETNLEWSKNIGINSSVAITCIKPEGTVSAYNGTSSGIHPSHAPQYIRYVRNDKKDPLTAFMIDQGFPYEEDAYDPQNVVAFKFPIKSSSKAIFKKDISAIKHLELWKIYQLYFTEHKPSITVSVKEHEWMQVGAWVYDNFEWMSGVAFLPAEEENMVYKQAPFTNCSEKEYQDLLSQMPTSVDWSKLSDYELEDMTVNQQTLACTGVDSCLI